MVKSRYLLGVICGALAAACYGMNPLGAVSLYREGFGTGTVLMFRFGFAAAMLAAFMLISQTSISLSRRELSVTPFGVGLVLVGICGGFTTFSTFSNETVELIRSGQGLLATAYALVSLAGGLAAVGLGWWVAR